LILARSAKGFNLPALCLGLAAFLCFSVGCAQEKTTLPMVTDEVQTDPYTNGITSAPNGAICFTQGYLTQRKSIGCLKDGQITTYAVVGATEIAAADDGNLWFTSGFYHFSGVVSGEPRYIGRITPKGKVSYYPLPALDAGAAGIVAGPLKSMWFGEEHANKIARIDHGGRIYEYPLPHKDSHPNAIATDHTGNIWFTESFRNTIGRISANGRLAEFAVSNNPRAKRMSFGGIAYGTDGKIWFTELSADRIGSLAEDGVVREYQLARKSRPDGIVFGPDGNMWFVEWGASKIGRITATGKVDEFATPNADALPTRIVVGPDKNLWFTEEDATHFLFFARGAIGKITLH
jgi:virginiamycin B lyase